jgi:hypothetical protein
MSTETDKSRGDVMDVNVRIEPMNWENLAGEWRLIADGKVLAIGTLDGLAILAEKVTVSVEVVRRLIDAGYIREVPSQGGIDEH